MYGGKDGRHTGLDGDLATKLILKAHMYINDFTHVELNGRGLVGNFSVEGAPIPVIWGLSMFKNIFILLYSFDNTFDIILS